MKVVLLPQPGGADALVYGEFPDLQPGPGEVLVHLAAAGINRLDIWVRNGWPGIKLQYPHILGADRAGQVLGCGEFAKYLSIIGSTMGTRQDFSTVMDLLFTGKLQVALDSTFPLEEARKAHEYLEKGFQIGKLTLEIPG